MLSCGIRIYRQEDGEIGNDRNGVESERQEHEETDSDLVMNPEFLNQRLDEFFLEDFFGFCFCEYLYQVEVALFRVVEDPINGHEFDID